MSTATKAYTVAVLAAALAATLMLPATGLGESWSTLVLLGLLAAVTGARSVHIPRLRVEVSSGDAFVFCSLLLVGPLAAPIVALAGVLGASFRSRSKGSLIRLAFNLGAVTLSAAAAAQAFLVAQRATATAVAGMLAAVTAFFMANTVLVALVLRLQQRKSFLSIWNESGLWSAGSSLTSGLVALGLAGVTAAVGPLGLAFGLAGSATIGASYRFHRLSREQRLQASQEALRALESHVETAVPATPDSVHGTDASRPTVAPGDPRHSDRPST